MLRRRRSAFVLSASLALCTLSANDTVHGAAVPTLAMPRDPIRRSRATDGSSARFVGGRSPGQRPSPSQPTVILPHGRCGGNQFLPWAWTRDIQGRPGHRRNGSVSPEKPRVFLRRRECDSGKSTSEPCSVADRTVFQQVLFLGIANGAAKDSLDFEQEETGGNGDHGTSRLPLVQ